MVLRGCRPWFQTMVLRGWGPLGHTTSTAGTFRKKFQKNSGKIPETLSERLLEFPSRVRLGCPKHYYSRPLRLPERFQNSLPPSTAGDASFFRIGSGAGHGIPSSTGGISDELRTLSLSYRAPSSTKTLHSQKSGCPSNPRLQNLEKGPK